MNFNEAFKKNPIIGVIRGIDKKYCTDIIDAAVGGGLTCVEIALNTADAISMVSLASVYFAGKCCVGAGTVLTLDQAKEALDSGAQYIVAPNTQIEIIEFCKENKIPVIPGALTPTEVYAAWKSGATLVKVFPVVCMGGPEYIKELCGPFSEIPLVAFSGVTLDKVDDYFKAGAKGFGLGNRLFNPEWIKDGNFGKIKESAESFTKTVKKFQKI